LTCGVRIVDATLIALGVGISLISGGTAAVVGGAFLGAGLNGLQSDSLAQSNGTDSETVWGTSLGIGAAFGAFGGAAEVAAKPLSVSAEALTEAGALEGAAAAKAYAGIALRVSAKVAIQTAIGGARGLVTQLVTNAIQHEPLDTNLAYTTGVGLLTGFGNSK
jgi:hypothetical protein